MQEALEKGVENQMTRSGAPQKKRGHSNFAVRIINQEAPTEALAWVTVQGSKFATRLIGQPSRLEKQAAAFEALKGQAVCLPVGSYELPL